MNPDPCSQAQDELSSLTGTQQLRDDLCRQTDELHHLLILHHIVLLDYLPYEGRHESHWRDEEM